MATEPRRGGLEAAKATIADDSADGATPVERTPGTRPALRGLAELGGPLGRGGDPAERLAKAKEILAQDPAGGPSIQALNVLFELEPETARAQLFALLGSEDAGAQAVVAAAVWSAGRLEGALSAQDLGTIFERGDVHARVAAAAVLEGRGDDSLARRYEDACALELASADPAVRLRGVEALAERRSETAAALLVPLLADADETVRFEALRSMRWGGPGADLDVLRGLENDPSERIARMATEIVRVRERRGQLPGDQRSRDR